MGAQRRAYIKAYCTRCDTMVGSNAWNRHRTACDSKPAKPGEAERIARSQAGIDEYVKSRQAMFGTGK